jgi:hypothetical protein
MATLPPSPPLPGPDVGPTDSAPSAVNPASRPSPSDAARPDAKAEREARLAAALRENLKRRKAQARARRSPGDNGGA